MARYHAPGRVTLIGEHTDYAGGLVLPVAIGRGLTLDCVPADRIRLRSGAGSGDVDLAADGGGAAAGFGRYVGALAAELADLGRAPAGIDGRIAADVPAGAGSPRRRRSWWRSVWRCATPPAWSSRRSRSRAPAGGPRSGR